MKIVTAELMRAIDRETIENRGIPGTDLMERAGSGIAERIRDDILVEPHDWKIAIFCGKGNNGGDGFVIGRYLHQYGCTVSIYYPGPPEKLSADARLNHDRAQKIGLQIINIGHREQLPREIDADYIIDAIFGTGFTGSPNGILSDLIAFINSRDIPVIAVDCPSGLNVDTGQHDGVVVKADYTYCLALPKIGLLYSPGRELAGVVDVIPIGIPDDVIQSFQIKENLITPDMVASLLPKRKPDGHKGDFGKLFILAGSTGLTGAATLSALASARAGLGLVTVGCPESLNHILEMKLTEPMTYPLPDVAGKGLLALRGLGAIKKKIAESDAVVIGPGIGRHHETEELIQRLVDALDKPALIDADGLNAFEKNREPLKKEHAGLILTPHPGEFRRLIDEDIPHDLPDKYDLVRKYALMYHAAIVLKESPSIVVDSDGSLYLNPTGNNGMATGGTGDVLSGIIGSFLAQGMTPLDSSVCGVYLHGLCGDLAAAEFGCRSLIAGDLIDHLPEAFAQIESAN
ncbi:MAG: NAD(P)H-hydrate dehydratase [candidate division Zixibacteria bacterium]|nr:NAD(P)H-hydrate dehydratase [candidate division Zixibacteria bacterium]